MNEIRSMGREALERIAVYYDTLAKRPVVAPTSAEALHGLIDEPLPPSPRNANRHRSEYASGSFGPCRYSSTEISGKLLVQVLHVERVFLDEGAAAFHVFAHQGGEDFLAFHQVLQADLQQRALLRV